MIFEPFQAFTACEFQIKFATEAWERRGAARLRHHVFCEEQGLFRDDRDAIDETAIPIVALSLLGVAADEVVGTVRIHEAEAGLWWGSRLAVCPRYRRVGALGTSLIQLAVSAAHMLGCRRFLAHVQEQNVPMFRRLHWSTLEEVTLYGRPHHRMEADLAAYPAFMNPEVGFLALPKRTA